METESVLVERIGDHFLLTYETPGERDFSHWVTETEDWLHSALCRGRYLRVGPVKGDSVAGLYVRKVAA